MWLRPFVPPLRRRLGFTEIRPGSLVSADPGLMAHTFGHIFAVASFLAALGLALGEPRGRLALVVSVVLGAAISITCLIGYGRLPIWFFQAVLAAASLLIAGVAVEASTGAAGYYALCDVWVVVGAFVFFAPRAAALQTAFAVASFGAALAVRGDELAPIYLIVMVAVLGTTGPVVGALRRGIERAASQLSAEAHTDPVTAIANRRGFDERFRGELARAERSGQPLSLVICDLDRFKRVNDELGHEQGDAALRRAVEAIVSSVRSIDTVARLGGEEFAVVLPEADRREALAVAERVRNGVLGAFSDHAVPLTASCGVATFDRGGRNGGEGAPGDGERGDAGAELFRAADGALYRAKRAGRNCTVAAEEAPGHRLAAG